MNGTTVRLAIVFALCVYPAFAQTAPATGSINGVVADKSGATVAGAQIGLTRDDGLPGAEVISGADGRFSFRDVPPGHFHLTVSAAGFAEHSTEGNLNSGEILDLPATELAVSVVVGNVDVKRSTAELAEEQIKKEERQRLFGFLPDFRISFVPDALPLTTRQKFELSWKSSFDPVTFGMIGLIAGIQQKNNDYKGFGQGAQGYASRFGALYAKSLTRSMISEALLPSLFKQDPRYFYKGTGSTRSRIVYALSRAVIRKGDNGAWQPNYSGILGRFATGALGNVYYPGTKRDWAQTTFVDGAINIGTSAGVNLLKEFLFKKLTPAARQSSTVQTGGIQTGKVAN